jgi:hypothetical protein
MGLWIAWGLSRLGRAVAWSRRFIRERLHAGRTFLTESFAIRRKQIATTQQLKN